MSNEEDLDQLPDAVVHNSEKEVDNSKTNNLLEQLLDHVQNNYIPWEKVQLPSRGLYYGNKMSDGWLEVRPMGVDVDKMLTNQRLMQSGELLNRVLEACTRLPPEFSIREMLSGDFNFLLYYLRGITHGPEYEFAADCPHCGTKNIFIFNLTELQSTVTWANPDYPHEPFNVPLPKLSQSFNHEVAAQVRMIRVDDIMRMARPNNDEIFDPVKRGGVSIKKKKQKTIVKNRGQDLERIYEDNMKSQIVGITVDNDPIKDRNAINKIIDTMHQGDAAEIRKFLEEVSPGMETTLEVVCNNEECGRETVVNLPFNENFFRPNN